jgi:hypothetical protein
MIRALFNAAQGKRGTGFIHSPLPASTEPLSTLIGSSSALPSSGTVRSALVGPKWQSATDSCLGMSGAQAFRIACLARGIPCPDLSGLFPYKLGRAAMGMGLEDTDAGLSFEGLLTAVTRFGFASEEAWPFNLMKVNARVSGTALHDGYDRRGVRSYYRIDSDDIDGVRRAIDKKIPVIGAWAVDKMFQIDSGPELIDKPDRDIVGNHAMVIEDFAPDGSFGLLNHYDRSWRSDGRCRFTEEYTRASLGFVAFDVGPSR